MESDDAKDLNVAGVVIAAAGVDLAGAKLAVGPVGSLVDCGTIINSTTEG